MSNKNGFPSNVNVITNTQATLLTPGLATWLLEHNDNVRHMVSKRVDSYARQMEAGQFDCNGQALQVNSRGFLINGQHRCAAVIKSGCSVWVYIIKVDTKGQGKKSGSSLNIDTGQGRTVSLEITAAGYKNANVLSTVAKHVYRWYDNPEETPSPSFVHKRTVADYPSRSDLLELIDKEDDKFQWSINAASTAMVTTTITGLVHYLATRYLDGDSEIPDEFFAILKGNKGEYSGSPTLALRRRLIQMRSDRRTVHVLEKFNLVMRAYSAFAKGQTLAKIPSRKNNEGAWSVRDIVVPPTLEELTRA